MLAGPSAVHPLGTDDLGRDLLSRLILGARVSLGIGVTSVLLALAAGIPLGLITGYLGADGGRGADALARQRHGPARPSAGTDHRRRATSWA